MVVVVPFITHLIIIIRAPPSDNWCLPENKRRTTEHADTHNNTRQKQRNKYKTNVCCLVVVCFVFVSGVCSVCFGVCVLL